jgi:hypothetical protein
MMELTFNIKNNLGNKQYELSSFSFLSLFSFLVGAGLECLVPSNHPSLASRGDTPPHPDMYWAFSMCSYCAKYFQLFQILTLSITDAIMMLVLQIRELKLRDAATILPKFP